MHCLLCASWVVARMTNGTTSTFAQIALSDVEKCTGCRKPAGRSGLFDVGYVQHEETFLDATHCLGTEREMRACR